MKGELDKMSKIVADNNVRELKKGYFLCEVSSSTTLLLTFCLKQKQLCDTSTGEARCICEEGRKGSRCEKLISEPPATLPTRMPTLVQYSGVCTDSSQCTTENTECVDGKCACKSGFTPRRGNCININECERSFRNDCHRDADCVDTEGSYQCSCKVGFNDVSLDFPGRKCRQTNECKIGTHNCDEATQVCLDRRPPQKWECVQRTPAPTSNPTPKPISPPTTELVPLTPQIEKVLCNNALTGEKVISLSQCLCQVTNSAANNYDRDQTCFLKTNPNGIGVTTFGILEKTICAQLGVCTNVP
jgi:Calcium-binding EGF domain/EB module